MSINYGSQKGSTKSQVIMPQASPQELELQNLNIQLAKSQLDEMNTAKTKQAAYEASPLYQTQQAIEQKASENLLARLTGQAPVLSPEEQARLDQIYDVSQRRGSEDIMRF